MKTALPYLLIAVSVGLFYIHIDPYYKQIETLQAQKAEYDAALAKVDELQQQKVRILDAYNSLPKFDLARLDRLLPEKLNTVKLVADMDGVAGKYAITVSNIKVTEEVVDRAQEVGGGELKPYRTTQVSFLFSASYENMVAFLKDLERSLQLIDIQTIAFETSDSEDAESNLGLTDYQVSFQTYSIQ